MRKALLLIGSALIVVLVMSNFVLITQLIKIKSEFSNLKNDADSERIVYYDSKYYQNDPYYRIIDVEPGRTYYQISANNTIFAEGVKSGSDPRIASMGEGIVKLDLGCGTNCMHIQYFDVYNDRTSEVYFSAGEYGDYVDLKNNLIAYFSLNVVDGTMKHILVIQDVFNKDTFYTEIERNYADAITPGIKMVFLNGNQLYIEYMTQESNASFNYGATSEIIDFR